MMAQPNESNACGGTCATLRSAAGGEDAEGRLLEAVECGSCDELQGCGRGGEGECRRGSDAVSDGV